MPAPWLSVLAFYDNSYD